MKRCPQQLIPMLVAAAFAFGGSAAQATPKAAEQEDAPVTTGADVARPKPSAKPMAKTATKKVAGKSARPAKVKAVHISTRAVKAVRRKK